MMLAILIKYVLVKLDKEVLGQISQVWPRIDRIKLLYGFYLLVVHSNGLTQINTLGKKGFMYSPQMESILAINIVYTNDSSLSLFSRSSIFSCFVLIFLTLTIFVGSSLAI